MVGLSGKPRPHCQRLGGADVGTPGGGRRQLAQNPGPGDSAGPGWWTHEMDRVNRGSGAPLGPAPQAESNETGRGNGRVFFGFGNHSAADLCAVVGNQIR